MKLKDSNVTYIGKIPFNWEVTKYKRFAKSGMGTTILKENLEDDGYPVYSATESEEIFGYLKNPKIILNPGDLIIPARGTIGYVKLVNKYCTSTQTTIYSRIQGINNEFLFYQAIGLKDWWFEYDKTAVPQITVKQVQNNPLLLPPEDIQRQIVSKLDFKIKRIDGLIENQQQQIEKLKEYKQSLISEVVTKGLDPNVDLKDSGVEWIGKIPSHWEITRLKDLLLEPLFYGSNKSGDTYSEKLPRYIRITDIQNDNLITDISSIQSYTHDDKHKYMVHEGDILFARSGATAGKTYLVKTEDQNNVFAGYLINGRFDKLKVKPEYVNYYTKSSIWDMWKNYIFIQSTIQNISAEKFNLFEISLPPLNEQEIISAYLDVKIKKIDKLIFIKEKKIKKQTEYKKSLIYEYVTGKKEVDS